jgi:hypothetical protein
MTIVMIKPVGVRLQEPLKTQIEEARKATGCGYTELVILCPAVQRRVRTHISAYLVPSGQNRRS